MSRKGENIYKRKDGRWEGRYIKGRTPTGGAIYGYLYAKNYRDLKRKMSHLDNMKEVLYSPSSKKPPILFKNISEEWMVSVQPRVKESTIVKYDNLLKNYILPYLGEKNIMMINHNQVDALCNELLSIGGKNKKGLSPKTVSDTLSLIRNIMRYSANKGYISLYAGSSITIKQQSKEIRILTKKEQEKICKYIYSNLNEKNLGILICLFTGLRVGEICALKWGDISFDEQILFVHQTMQRIQIKNNSNGRKTKILISAPKSPCSIRTIPLPEGLMKVLREHSKAVDAYVLTGSASKYIEPRTMQNHFKKIIQRCSVADANFHSLRHTFATRCVEVGFDIKSLSEILGHASVNITMNRYVHPSLELKQENMNRLFKFIAVS